MKVRAIHCPYTDCDLAGKRIIDYAVVNPKFQIPKGQRTSLNWKNRTRHSDEGRLDSEGWKELSKKKARRACCAVREVGMVSIQECVQMNTKVVIFYNKTALSSSWLWDQTECNEGNTNIGRYTSGIKGFISYFQRFRHQNPGEEALARAQVITDSNYASDAKQTANNAIICNQNRIAV